MCYVLKKKYFTDYFSLTGNIKTKQNMLEIPIDWRKTGLDLNINYLKYEDPNYNIKGSFHGQRSLVPYSKPKLKSM